MEMLRWRARQTRARHHATQNICRHVLVHLRQPLRHDTSEFFTRLPPRCRRAPPLTTRRRSFDACTRRRRASARDAASAKAQSFI